MKYIFTLFIFMATLAFADTLSRENAEATVHLDKVSLQLHWKYQFEFAGFIAAKEKGFYEEAGLDVELKEYVHGMNVVEEVLSKKSNYGIYNSNILLGYLNNQPLLLLSSYFKRSALILITKPGIKSPTDLVGKTIMSSGEDDFNINFKSLFDIYDINTGTLKFVEHTYSVDDFAASDLDAMTAFISDQPYCLNKLGVKYNIINPSDYGTFNLQLELFTSQEEALSNFSRTKKFRDASIKGWQYAFTHQEEIIEIIYNKYSKKNSKDFLKNEAKEIRKLILPFTYSIGSIDKNYLSRQLEIFKQNYHLKNDKTVDDFIFDESVKDNQLELTEGELEYLKSHKIINVCLQYNQFPYDGYENKAHTGIMSSIFNIISENLNVEFRAVTTTSHNDLMSKVLNKKCEILSILPTQSKHFPNIIATKPFVKSHFTLISELDKSFIQNPMQLKDKLLLVQFPIYKDYLIHLYPYLTIEVEEDVNKLMKKIFDGTAYASLEVDEKADYLVDKYGYGKLKINGFLAKDKPIPGSIGVQKDEAVLFSIMQKALENISEQRIETIINSWRLTRYQNRTDYHLVIKILMVVGFIILLMAYYQRKLQHFNIELEKQVKEKTRELQEINESLEHTVQEKVEELIQKDKILTVQSKQAVMGEMISMIAHQWRQPLSTITLQISNLQIKRMMGEAVDDVKVEDTLNKISDTIMYLSDTVDDFQTYFRTDKTSTRVEVHEVLEKVANFVLPRIQNINLEIKKEEEIYVDVYINELMQVIINIVNNAIDSFEGIQRENKKITLYAQSKDENVCICVEDNGSGILEQDLNKLFEPYFSTKGKNGTGLGLYMSQMIIEKQFNGKINVQSSQEGSLFIVEIHKSV
ncbi:ABC transporter substrate-binding protein [bacterium]|nr:ABC transporter substrate-binding protein [bacterium]MBU1993119.1 ABC transporter substrate-binding protein [bacterium]